MSKISLKIVSGSDFLMFAKSTSSCGNDRGPPHSSWKEQPDSGERAGAKYANHVSQMLESDSQAP